ncbi:MAG: hypothetical protein HY744_10290, partial [Deltaproteobacteria bacterium]|nr:hypothetical protein [Deltaproteobacteria bacterium]
MNRADAKTWKPGRNASVALVACLGGLLGAAACGDEGSGDIPAGSYSQIVERLTQSSVDKIDLLLVIDNSRSMADKQRILKEAVPDLVGSLVNPRCVDQSGKPAQSQPQDPAAECPSNTWREFDSINDIHIGIISSSIGGHGADACDPEKAPTQNF